MEFFELLRNRRLALGLTQQKVAKELGIDHSTYAHYESGRRTPDLEKLKILCRLFSISIEDHLPLVRTLEYPPELLQKLQRKKEQVEGKLRLLEASYGSLEPRVLRQKTQALIEELQTAIEPVQIIWEETLTAPELDPSVFKDERTVLRVTYRPEDWILLSEALQLQKRVINFMFRPGENQQDKE